MGNQQVSLLNRGVVNMNRKLTYDLTNYLRENFNDHPVKE